MSHNSRVESIAFSPDGKYLATASWDKTARVWEIAIGREVTRMHHENDVEFIAFSPDGKYVATASFDETARVWKATTGEQIARMNHEGWVSSVAFSPDGKYVATASFDKTVRVWEATTGEQIARMNHEGWVSSIAFSPDGKHLAMASEDKTARVLEVYSGKEVARIINHEDKVNSITFSPNGRYLATASNDDTAAVWRFLRPEEMIYEACSRLARNLSYKEWQQYFPDEPYRKTCPNLPVHPSFIEAGRNLAKVGDIDGAVSIFNRALKLDPTLEISVDSWNTLGWFGSLWGHPADVMYACQKAVELEPENGSLRDARGLARALTGDTKGAIEDFKFFIESAKKHSKSLELIPQRESWIQNLEAGRNPFTQETLEALRNE